jgi:hypothetical protein
MPILSLWCSTPTSAKSSLYFTWPSFLQQKICVTINSQVLFRQQIVREKQQEISLTSSISANKILMKRLSSASKLRKHLTQRFSTSIRWLLIGLQIRSKQSCQKWTPISKIILSRRKKCMSKLPKRWKSSIRLLTSKLSSKRKKIQLRDKGSPGETSSNKKRLKWERLKSKSKVYRRRSNHWPKKKLQESKEKNQTTKTLMPSSRSEVSIPSRTSKRWSLIERQIESARQ